MPKQHYLGSGFGGLGFRGLGFKGLGFRDCHMGYT